MAEINVTKYSGEQEVYDEDKLKRSLSRAGAESQVINKIADSLRNELYDGISTKKIYREAYRQLKNHSDRSGGRYKLKNSIMELGPTGFPFENFVAELLSQLGYRTQTGITVQGRCATHEIDVIAEKEDVVYMIECKFHNSKGKKSDIKVPLYIKSRFDDVKEEWRTDPDFKHKEHHGWVITNTRFTSDAQQYGTCAGLDMLSWDYPEAGSLRDLIDRAGLHPVTSIPSLSKKDKSRLLELDVVLCKDLHDNKKVLHEAGVKPGKINKIIKEATEISKLNHNR